MREKRDRPPRGYDKTNSIARIIESSDPITTAERFFSLAAEGGTMRTDKPNIKVAELKEK